jgi:hypothetical protein
MKTTDPGFPEWLGEMIEGHLPPETLAQRLHVLQHDPEALAAWCRQMRLHALLTWKHGRTQALSPPPVMPARMPSSTRWRWLGAAAALILLAAGSILLFRPPSANAAAAALERMIAVTARSGDRTYRLNVLEGGSSFQLLNHQTASCEGALLHLGSGSQFVYECDLSDGSRRITGSDGLTSWDILGPAPVHLSTDPTRFRHHLPGQQEDFSYLDPGAQLALLREGYDIVLVPGTVSGRQQLKAVKRSRAYRGPREAIITFEENSGTIQTIDLHGLPLARGGPTALRLTLTSQDTFPSGFFQHTAHHEPGRPIEMEPARTSR